MRWSRVQGEGEIEMEWNVQNPNIEKFDDLAEKVIVIVICKWETATRTKAEAFLAPTIRNHGIDSIAHLLLATSVSGLQYANYHQQSSSSCHRYPREIKLIKTRPQATHRAFPTPQKHSRISEPKGPLHTTSLGNGTSPSPSQLWSVL
jgi:hypothetical protein